jgi:hypothetical protein
MKKSFYYCSISRHPTKILPKNFIAEHLEQKTLQSYFYIGGPDYNCAGFEVSTAQELANNGFLCYCL